MTNYNGYNYSNNEQFKWFYCVKDTEKPWVTGYESEVDVKQAIDEQVARDNTPAVDPIQDQLEELQLAVAELGEMIGGNE